MRKQRERVWRKLKTSHLASRDQDCACILRQSWLDEFMNSGYRAYLNSRHWKILRAMKLKTVKHCEYHRCQRREHLDVHHIRYRNLYDVTLKDLRVLCREHHKQAHKIFKPLPLPVRSARPLHWRVVQAILPILIRRMQGMIDSGNAAKKSKTSKEYGMVGAFEKVGHFRMVPISGV